jgi:hypothetical protein
MDEIYVESFDYYKFQEIQTDRYHDVSPETIVTYNNKEYLSLRHDFTKGVTLFHRLNEFYYDNVDKNFYIKMYDLVNKNDVKINIRYTNLYLFFNKILKKKLPEYFL